MIEEVARTWGYRPHRAHHPAGRARRVGRADRPPAAASAGSATSWPAPASTRPGRPPSWPPATSSGPGSTRRAVEVENPLDRSESHPAHRAAPRPAEGGQVQRGPAGRGRGLFEIGHVFALPRRPRGHSRRDRAAGRHRGAAAAAAEADAGATDGSTGGGRRPRCDLALPGGRPPPAGRRRMDRRPRCAGLAPDPGGPPRRCRRAAPWAPSARSTRTSSTAYGLRQRLGLSHRVRRRPAGRTPPARPGPGGEPLPGQRRRPGLRGGRHGPGRRSCRPRSPGAGGDLLERVWLFDVYRSAQLGPGRRSLAFRLRFRALDRTLDDTELAAVRQRAIDAVVSRARGGAAGVSAVRSRPPTAATQAAPPGAGRGRGTSVTSAATEARDGRPLRWRRLFRADGLDRLTAADFATGRGAAAAHRRRSAYRATRWPRAAWPRPGRRPGLVPPADARRPSAPRASTRPGSGRPTWPSSTWP